MSELTTTTDLQLKEIAKTLRIPRFKVYSVDKLPSKMSLGNYVINADNSDGPGTHWTAVHHSAKQDYAIHFDPFGQASDPRIIQFMKSQSKPSVALNVQSQALDASSCGWWCLYFLKEMQLGVTPAKFLAKIDGDDQEANEMLLRNYFHT